MARPKSSANEPHKILAALALRHPGAEEGIACAGTAIEKRTIRARNKAFLFLGPRDAMLELRESLGEAQPTKKTATKKAGPRRR